MISLNEVQDDIAKQLEAGYKHLAPKECAEMCRYGLVGEVGEVMEILKKRLRYRFEDVGKCSDNDFKLELGDVLWYLTALCVTHGTSLEEIYKLNCEKLDGRGWR